MNKLTYVFVCALLSHSSAVHAQRPANAIEGYATYSEMYANAPVGGCGCFWIGGGTGGFAIPWWGTFPRWSRLEATLLIRSHASIQA